MGSVDAMQVRKDWQYEGNIRNSIFESAFVYYRFFLSDLDFQLLLVIAFVCTALPTSLLSSLPRSSSSLHHLHVIFMLFAGGHLLVAVLALEISAHADSNPRLISR